LKKTKYQEDPG